MAKHAIVAANFNVLQAQQLHNNTDERQFTLPEPSAIVTGDYVLKAINYSSKFRLIPPLAPAADLIQPRSIS